MLNCEISCYAKNQGIVHRLVWQQTKNVLERTNFSGMNVAPSHDTTKSERKRIDKSKKRRPEASQLSYLLIQGLKSF